MRTIGIDVREAMTDTPAGKAHNARELTRAVLPRLQEAHVVMYSDKPIGDVFGDVRDMTVQVVRWPGLLWHLAVWFRMTFVDRVDLYFSPTSTIIPALSSKCIPMIHDLVAFLDITKHQAKATWIERLTVPMALRKAKHIVTPSDSTARDLHKWFDVPMNRMTTIYPGVGLSLFGASASPSSVEGRLRGADSRRSQTMRGPSTEEGGVSQLRSKYNLPEDPYFLFVSTLEPRKNIVRILEAYADLRDRRGEGIPKFVFVGKQGWNFDDIFETLERLHLKDSVVFTGFVETDELPLFYKGALAFIFPSLYEGFGMPVLEAMDSGVPILTSNVSSLPEVAGDAALQVDPKDVAAISSAMEKLADDRGVRARLSEAGRTRSKKFSWDHSAEKLESILEVGIDDEKKSLLPRPIFVSLVIAVCLGIISSAVAAVFLGWLGAFVVLGALVFIGIFFASMYNPKIGVFVVAFLLPFERIGSIDLAGTTVRASQVVLLAALLGWVFALLFRRTKLRLDGWVYIPMVLFLGVGFLSLIQAENLMRGVTVLAFTMFVMLLTVLLPSVLTSEKDIKKVIQLVLLSAVLVSLFGLYQFVGDMIGIPPEVTGLRPQYTKEIFGFPRVQSTALEPLYFANYLLIPISLALVYFLFRRRSRAGLPIRQWSAFVLLLLASLNALLTMSRGGYLGLAAVAIFVFFVWFLDGIRVHRIAALAIVGVVAVVGAYGALLITGQDENVEEFILQATSYQESAGVVERFITYEQAGRLIIDHPWLGVGVGNFGPAVASSSWVQPQNGWAIVNNEYLEIFAEMGVFGLSLFLLIIAVVVISSARAVSLRRVREGVSGGSNVSDDASAGRLAWFGALRRRATEDRASRRWKRRESSEGSLGHQKQRSFLSLTLLALLATLFGILVQYNTFSILYILHIWFVIGLILAIRGVLRDTGANAHT